MNIIKPTLPNTQTTKGLILFCGLLIFIGMIGSFTIDMYVPSMPAIAQSFSITPTAIKFSITIYLITYGLGQFFYGPTIDCFGRKYVLLSGIIIGMIGSIFCLSSHSISTLYLGRLLQGAGYSAIGVTTPVLARDTLDDLKFAQIGSTISMAFGLGPVLSPILGSYIGHWFGWRMIFTVITIYSALIFLAILFFIPETLDKKNRHVFHIKPIMQTYKRIISNNIFLANTLCKSIGYTGFIVFYTVTPFIMQDRLGLSAIQYGWVTLTLTGTLLLAKLANTILLKYVDINELILLATFVLAFAGCSLLILAALNIYTLYAILIPFMIFGLGAGFLFSNATISAFKPFKNIAAGSVAGLLNGLQLLSAFIGSAIAAHLGLSTLLPLGIFMAIIGISVVVQYAGLTAKK